MATAAQLLDIARAELGTIESPAGSNKVKYSTWYGLTGPWCVMFVMWCYQQAGVELPIRTASCSALRSAAQSAGMWVTGGYRPVTL
jgi:cell wall-associated NlpC family hydrolase